MLFICTETEMFDQVKLFIAYWNGTICDGRWLMLDISKNGIRQTGPKRKRYQRVATTTAGNTCYLICDSNGWLHWYAEYWMLNAVESILEFVLHNIILSITPFIWPNTIVGTINVFPNGQQLSAHSIYSIIKKI